MGPSKTSPPLRPVDSRYREAADLLDGYVHESVFLRNDSSPDHRIVWASDGFATIFGCTVDQYNRGGLWGGVYDPQDSDAALRRAAALRRGETVEAELRILRNNEDVRWLYVKNKPIVEPATGRVTGVLGVGLDITQRKLAEQRQHKADEALRIHQIILETMQEGVLMFDAMNIVRYSNEACQRMFRMGAQALACLPIARLGLNYLSICHDLGNAVQDRHMASPDMVCQRADGTQFVAKLAFAEFRRGEQLLVIAVLRDVTEQRQLEREIIDIASREQERIAWDLHDGLGQELTGIALMLRSFAERSSRLHPGMTESFEEIIALVNRAINETRTLAQGLSPVDLQRGGLPSALSALAARSSESSTIVVTFKYQGRQASAPAAAAGHLYRIAQEAVSNALRHSGAESIRICLSSWANKWELAIADDGRGMTEAPSAGGMGLKIMDYRARMIGAKITVRRRLQGGTVVRCRLSQGETSQPTIAPLLQGM